MILTHSPSALPGSCYLCGSASREAYVDTNRQVEFHGAMYLCNLCIAEMSQLLGFTTPDQAEGLRQELETTRVDLFNAQREAAGLWKAVDGLRNAGVCPDPVAHVHPDSVARMVVPSEASAKSDNSAERDAGSGTVDMGHGTGAAHESVHDENVGELRSDVSSDGSTRSEFSLDL